MNLDPSVLSRSVGEALAQRGWSLAVAESCTGGLFTARLTDVPGSSKYVAGGVIAYADSVKTDVLGVPREALSRHGAVSRRTAREMAAGVVRLLGVEVGVAITGIAGPGGGTRDKPVGTVWIGIHLPEGAIEEELRLAGDRTAIREGASARALRLLLREVTAWHGGRPDENPEGISG